VLVSGENPNKADAKLAVPDPWDTAGHKPEFPEGICLGKVIQADSWLVRAGRHNGLLQILEKGKPQVCLVVGDNTYNGVIQDAARVSEVFVRMVIVVDDVITLTVRVSSMCENVKG